MTTTILASFPSPSQGVWHIGFIPIRAYALCIIAGIVAALIIGDRRWAARGGQRGVIYDIALWAVPFGLVGGRLYHVMTDWPTYFGPGGFGFLAALRIWDGGLGIWGAVALGAVGAWIGCRTHGIPLPAFGDAIAPGIILAQAIGRLGNYFNQELYGGPTDLPWGLEIFYRVNPATGEQDKLNGVSTGQLLDSAPVPVHPTFLYELLWNLLIFAVLLWADRRFRLGHGRLFALYVAGYCVGRFGIELLRQDHASLIAGIRVNTFTSAIVFLGAVLYIVVAAKGREAPETLWGKSPPGDEASEAHQDGEREALAATGPSQVPVAAGVASVGASSAAVAAAGGAAAGGSVAGPEPTEEVGAPDDGAAQGSDETGDLESTVNQAVPEAGLGSVDGEDVAAAEDDAASVHEAVVDGAQQADATAATVADEPVADEPPNGAAPQGSDETGDLESTVNQAVPEAGLGSVAGEDVAAAEDDAASVHEAVVDGAQEADATAAAVADEPVADKQVAEADGTEADDAAEPRDDTPAGPEEDEVSTGDADGLDSTVNEVVPEAGLGSVDGEDVTAAKGDAAAVHDAAVAGADSADATTGDAAEESEPSSEPGADGAVAPLEASGAKIEDETNDLDSTVNEVVPEAGLGSVDGQDVTAAEGDAAEVHDAAVEQVADADAAAADVAREPTPDSGQPPASERRRWWRRGN